MQKMLRMLAVSASLATLATFTTLSSAQAADAAAAVSEEALAQGKEIAFDMFKGNCLACHMMAGGELPGNIGPPLIAMKVRIPDRAKLRGQIGDARTANPDTIMPPFGAHGMLTEAELDLVTDYIHSL